MHWQLRLWLGLTRGVPLLAPMALRRRLARGKEDPTRWREKLGEPSLPRPDGPLVWLHAVGLGEVLALRGLIAAMSAQDPRLEFLVTSTARSSGQAMAGQLPPRTRHQFLPLDAPQYMARFLDHWRPGLSVWAEQDLWPGAVVAADQRGIPLAMVNARLGADGFARRQRGRGLYGDLLRRFRLIAAQDPMSADHLTQLGAADVSVQGPLKAAAPPLAADPVALDAARGQLAGRTPWLLASSHPEDEAIALATQAQLHAADPKRLLIIAPRDPARAGEIAAKAQALGLTVAQRSAGGPGAAAVWIADSFGEMGLWYRLCPVTLVGGTFGPTEGHNPWEPAALGSAVLHGPRVANFTMDYSILAQAAAAFPVDADGLAVAVTGDHAARVAQAQTLGEQARQGLEPLAAELVAMVRT